MTKSQVMSIYNKAKAAARKGALDPQRTNRALGIIMSKDGGAAKFAQYHTTTAACDCMDHRQGHTCKHMIARMIERRISQQTAVVKPEQPKQVYLISKGDYIVAEQVCASAYRLHIFPDQYEMDKFITGASHKTLVHPGSAKGKRLGNEQHGYSE